MHKDIPFEWTQAMGICDEDRNEHEGFWPVWERIGLTCNFISFTAWPEIRLLFKGRNEGHQKLNETEVMDHILKIRQAIVAHRLTQ